MDIVDAAVVIVVVVVAVIADVDSLEIEFGINFKCRDNTYYLRNTRCKSESNELTQYQQIFWTGKPVLKLYLPRVLLTTDLVY
jgi:hypothetical protein